MFSGGLRTKGITKQSQEYKPLITVVTVVRNGEKTLEKTILSVINQTYTNIEYIIIDGDSTDETLNIIKKYKDRIDYWLSEPDKGIYDAMNKGIDQATGDYIYFLGSDDSIYENDSIEKIISSCDMNEDLVFSKIKYTNGRYVKSSLGFKTLLHNTVHHQSAIYNKKLFINFRYDNNYKLISDYELNLIIYKDKMKYQFVNIILAECTDGGISRKQKKIAFKETNLIREKVMGKSFFLRFIYGCKFFISNLKNYV